MNKKIGTNNEIESGAWWYEKMLCTLIYCIRYYDTMEKMNKDGLRAYCLCYTRKQVHIHFTFKLLR